MDNLLETEILLGRDAEEFCNSDLGRYLLERADVEIQEWTEKMKEINPFMPWAKRKLRECQNEIYKREAFKKYLADAILNGRQALQLFEEQQ